MRRRLRAQQGFTIVELLIAMSILGIVAAGAMTMIQVVLHQSRGVVERTDAMQRGRLALDEMTRQIRSQVCLNATTPGLAAATASSLTFYSDFSDGYVDVPAQRTVTYDPASQRITSQKSDGVKDAAGAITFPTVTERRQVLSDAVLVPDTTLSPPAVPIFQYFAYTSGAAPWTPSVALTSFPLSAADLARTARIRITFVARSTTAKDDTFATRFADDVFLRTADPNATKPDPKCR
jgi:prepilin-type N-terminal cleavage/methylation domain-containing protein